jgi:hypothetical protein
MFSNQMGLFMPITYLPPTAHLQSYNLHTNPPTYLPITYLDVLPIYPFTCIYAHL